MFPSPLNYQFKIKWSKTYLFAWNTKLLKIIYLLKLLIICLIAWNYLNVWNTLLSEIPYCLKYLIVYLPYCLKYLIAWITLLPEIPYRLFTLLPEIPYCLNYLNVWNTLLPEISDCLWHIYYNYLLSNLKFVVIIPKPIISDFWRTAYISWDSNSLNQSY